MQQFAIGLSFGNNFEIDEQEFLQRVVVHWQAILNDGHEETWQLVSIEN